ncbi:hypothetical protein AB4Y89_19240 [Terriglobus sp. 2YAB30_2]|uniref:hypothetical protein n=1 Tax=unclassified Terriglobus TaxID=2628988 RepID=UPI003F9C3278
MLKWNQALFAEYLRQTGASLIVLAYGTNEAAAKWTRDEYATSLGHLVDVLHETLSLGLN